VVFELPVVYGLWLLPMYMTCPALSFILYTPGFSGIVLIFYFKLSGILVKQTPSLISLYSASFI